MTCSFVLLEDFKMAITDEQLDLLIEDEELARYSKEYQEYRMTYKEFRSKRDNVYKRLGIEIDRSPHNHQDRLVRLEELLSEGYISQDMYNKKQKRILHDINDESMEDKLNLEQIAKAIQELSEEMLYRFDNLEKRLDKLENTVNGIGLSQSDIKLIKQGELREWKSNH